MLRYLAIIAFVLLMGGIIFFTGENIRTRSSRETQWEHFQPNNHGDQGKLGAILKAEAGAFIPRKVSLAYDVRPTVKDKRRSLEEYYERRAYLGAPPTIPHEVSPDVNRNQRCNTCHKKGGFAPTFQAYVPITPHPEYSNCMQCHVIKQEKDLFVEIDWTSVKRPDIQRPALPGSPPPIPHTLQLRESCLSCHAGPAAPLEIRTTHPERENCRQCHVPKETMSIFERPQTQ